MTSPDKVAALCTALQEEPLFHMSLGSKELFHSNFLAWFADRFPEQAAATFRRWTPALPGAKPTGSKRELGHLDLILHLPDLVPIAIENKVFSVPDETQLERYTERALINRGTAAPAYARILLSLMHPGWTEHKGWQLLTYHELAEALRPHIASVSAADAFAGDLLKHYVTLISLLVDLLDLLGTPSSDAPLLLPIEVMHQLERVRVSAAVQKARASHVARELQRAVNANSWTGVSLSQGFSNGTSLLQAFRHRSSDGAPTDDKLGWQIQGTQFRLAVVTSVLRGPAHRKERELYVAERYMPWFNFAPLEAITGVIGKTRPNEVRDDRRSFQGYNPDFVYRYRTAPALTPTQIIELGLLYLERAGLLLQDHTPGGEPGLPRG